MLPTLSEVLNIMRRVGEAKAAALGTSLYDALLDEFEPGGRSAHIDTLFAELRSFLPDLLGRVLDGAGSVVVTVARSARPSGGTCQVGRPRMRSRR